MKRIFIIFLTVMLLCFGCGGDDDSGGEDTAELNGSSTSDLLQLSPGDTGPFSAYGRTQFKITSTGDCYIAFDLLSSDKTQWFGTMNHSGTKSLFVYNLQEGQYYIESDDSGTCDWNIEISSLGIDESLPYHTGQDPENKPDNNYSSSPGGSVTPTPDNNTNTDGNGTDDNEDSIPEDCQEDKYNCSSFDTCSEAMEIYNKCFPYKGDIHGLGGEDDNIPCNSKGLVCY